MFSLKGSVILIDNKLSDILDHRLVALNIISRRKGLIYDKMKISLKSMTVYT